MNNTQTQPADTDREQERDRASCTIIKHTMQDSTELNPDDFPEGKEQTLDVMPSSPSDVSTQELSPDDFPEA